MTIRWKPATTPNIVTYVLLFSDTGLEGPYTELATIMNLPMGPNWNSAESLYVYDDPGAISYRRYRMSTMDASGTVFTDTTSPPFEDNNDPYVLPVRNTFPLDENYTGVGAYRYVTPYGEPVEGAVVRLYTRADWYAGIFTRVVGITTTTSTGSWKSPILVEPGNTYMLQYHLPNVYGPDLVEITV